MVNNSGGTGAKRSGLECMILRLSAGVWCGGGMDNRSWLWREHGGMSTQSSSGISNTGLAGPGGVG